MANPFSSDDRPGHAESSGAAAVAAGVLLLAIGCNPDLELGDLDALLVETSSPVDASKQGMESGLADRNDLLPFGTDPDGHNAKHGYGRLNAAAICLAASDPVALTLLRIGGCDAALRYVEANIGAGAPAAYSSRIARWAARAALRNARLENALASLLRAIRLACSHPERSLGQPPGHLLRHAGVIVRMLYESGPNLVLASELREIDHQVCNILDSGNVRDLEATLVQALSAAFLAEHGASRSVVAPANARHTSGSRTAHVEQRSPGASGGNRARVTNSRV